MWDAVSAWETDDGDLKNKHKPTHTCSFTFTASMLITLFWEKKENTESDLEGR